MKRGIAVLEETSIQRKRTELAELAILCGDIFANAPPDVGRPEFSLNELQRHCADHIVSDLYWQVGRDRRSNEHKDIGSLRSDSRRPEDLGATRRRLRVVNFRVCSRKTHDDPFELLFFWPSA